MTAPTEEEILHLVGLIYDATLDEGKWPTFLEAFTKAVSAGSSFLRYSDHQNGLADFAASVGYDPAWRKAYCEHFIKLDYLIPALNRFEVGEVKTSDSLYRLSEQRKTEYFNDYNAPQEKEHAQGVVLIRDGNQSLVFATQRGTRAGEFGDDENRLMKIVAPHLIRAVRLHRQINVQATDNEYALGALDQLRMGVILTNSSGTPLFINHAAELMLKSGDGIMLTHNNLVLRTPNETRQLHKLISEASVDRQGKRGGDMSVYLPRTYKTLQCMVTPISSEIPARWKLTGEEGCVAIFLSEPGCLALSPERIAALYRLTPAESRLVAKLMEFKKVEEAANELGISVQTVRTQLRSVFSKTGAKSQAELLALIATGTLAHTSD